MRRRTLLVSSLAASLAASLSAFPALSHAAPAFTNAAIVLLQADELMLQRVRSAQELAAYIKAVEVAAGQAIDGAFQRKPAGGFVVVAVKPGGRSRVWLDLDAPLPAATQQALRAGIEAVPAPDVQGGPIVFAFKASFWGGRPPTRGAPAPQQWKDEAARVGQKLEVGALVERLWPD